MSLVGPRPNLFNQEELIEERTQRGVYDVRPGITGLAQVNGCRGETKSLEDMEARIMYDLEYVRNWTPMLDLRILLMTVIHVLRGENAY